MDAVVAVVVANAVLATVAAALVAGVCGLVRRPAVANRAWLLVLLKLVTPPMVGLSVGWAATPEPRTAADSAPPPTVSAPVPLPDEPTELPVLPTVPAPAVEALTVRPTAAEPPPEPAPTPDPTPAPAFAWVRPTLLAVWAGGAVGWWAVVAMRVARFRRVLRVVGSASNELTAAVAVVASRFGLRPPAAVLVDAPVSPLVWAGFGRPVLVFPARLWASLSADQRDAVLAHELAHLARGDHWVRHLEVVVLGVYWWLPTAWLAVRQLRRAEEVCCDAWAVGGDPVRAVGYADALVEAVAVLSGRTVVPLASGGAAGLGELNRRVTMILTNRPAPRLGPTARGLVAVAAVGLLPWGVTLADDPAKPVPSLPGVEPPSGEPRAVLGLRLTARQADHDAQAKAAEVALAVARENLARAEQLVKKGFATAEQARVAKLELDAAAAQLEAAKARQQASRSEPGRGGATATFTAVPAEEVERLKEEIELLTVQTDIRRAAVIQAEAALRQAARKVEAARGMVKTGFADAGTVADAEGAAQSAEAQLMIRRAEMKEHELRITHVKRRLDRSMPRILPPAAAPNRGQDPAVTTPRPTDPTAEQSALLALRQELVASRQRAEEMAKKIDILTAEMRRMRDERDHLTALVQRLEKQLDQTTRKK